MPTEDNLLIVIVANTQFNESLQDQVQQLHLKQLHCIMADVSIEKLAKKESECTIHKYVQMHNYSHSQSTYLCKEGHFSYKIDGDKVVFLLSQVVLHQPILIVTHQAQHLLGMGNMGSTEVCRHTLYCICSIRSIIMSHQKGAKEHLWHAICFKNVSCNL